MADLVEVVAVTAPSRSDPSKPPLTQLIDRGESATPDLSGLIIELPEAHPRNQIGTRAPAARRVGGDAHEG